MSSRRKFLKSAAVLSGMAVLPVNDGIASNNDFSLDKILDLPKANSEDEYWKSIRLQFPLKEGQTYFNNGTMGPIPSYTLNKVIDDLRYNAIHGSETDYKGEGPQLLTGYFKYEDVRKKIGDIINASFDEIALTQNATFGMNYVAMA